MITKHVLKSFRECAKRAHLDFHRTDLKVPPDDGTRLIMDRARRTRLLARKQWPEYEVVAPTGPSDEEAAAATNALLATSVEGIHRATFLSGNLLAKADMVVRNPSGWTLITVHSSKEAKPKYVEDLVFARLVALESGINVTALAVAHISPTVDHGAEGEWFIVVDVTEQGDKLEDKVRETVSALQTTLANDEPVVDHFKHCDACDYAGICIAHLGPADVMYIPRATSAKVLKWRSDGFANITDLDEAMAVQNKVSLLRSSFEAGGAVFTDGLKEALEKIQYPAAYVDFEVCQPPIPLFPGDRTYTPIPFQWSAHLLDEPGGELRHVGFLGRDFTVDPRDEFLESLASTVAEAKTVVYYSTFENSSLKALAAKGHPAGSDLLEKFKTDGVDLLPIVRENFYHPDLRGSFSIKKVLPALVPELSYAGMGIADGQVAAGRYLLGLEGWLTPDEQQQVLDDLWEYCKLDTLAMVEIHRALERLVGVRN